MNPAPVQERVRPRPTSYRPQVDRLHQFFEASHDRTPDAVALLENGCPRTYQELERWSNQLAHHLRDCGVRQGSRVAILLRRSAMTYVSLLGVLKAGAAFVPIDPASPPDRVTYIANDADVHLVITSSDLAINLSDLRRTLLEVDLVEHVLDAAPAHRPAPGATEDDVTAYVIYTSGSSGRPKGVEVAQSSICNFIDVVTGVYDVRPSDRVYQGMTISFDFSIEEIWPTWAVGATLVTGPDDERRLGAELADFLDQAGVTVLYCVPTLLATIPRELPSVRSLMVGGEACPGELVERWSVPGRRMLNTYGPTEATVTATWCELVPGQPVTIGRPLPTYSVALLDDALRPVSDGEVGEICIGGPGVARGYVGMPDKTADRFVEHPLAPGDGRLYRTGDLGRLDPDGDIAYLGRADAEVKVRGHRVDLGEIDSVLLEDAAVASAVAALVPGGVSDELAAYVVGRAADADDEMLLDRVHERLRGRLPDYMVPAYLELVPALPTMPSGKVDRARLPEPRGRRMVGSGPIVPPADELEQQVRDVWAEVFGMAPDELSVEADFFDDLGGHSLLAATAVSLLRERAIGGTPAIRELYSNPTVRALAGWLAATAPAEGAEPLPSPRRYRWPRIALAGAAQAAMLLALLLVVTLPISVVYSRSGGTVSLAVLGQLALGTLASYLLVRWIAPVLLARPLAAGIAPGRYPLWGTTYLRMWALDTVLALAPVHTLSGSPLLAPYLRLLGARIGRGCHLGTGGFVLPAMVRIDDGAALGYGVQVRPWAVRDGWVVVAPVVVGADAVVGSSSVLEPGATVGRCAVLAAHSSVVGEHSVPADQWWGGSPAAPRSEPEPDVATMLELPAPKGWTGPQRAGLAGGLLLVEALPVLMMAPSVVLVWVMLTSGVVPGLLAALTVGPIFVVSVCLLVAGTHRVVLPSTPPGIHPQRSGLGVRKWMADRLLDMSLTFTNSLYATLYTAPWLRALGARIGRQAEVSTAAHLDPDLLHLRDESFVADMASIGSATFANGYVAFRPTEVGQRAFVGNAAFVPAGTRMGDGSLVGVHSVPPPEGVPAGTSWLGSPAMHLPRRQDSGEYPEELTFRPRRRQVAERLGIEFFRMTLPASLLAMNLYLFLLVVSQLAAATGPLTTALVAPLVAVLAAVAVVLCVVALKWIVVGRYRPRVEPMWSRFVRRTEFVTGLYEAAAVPALVGALIGTPFLPPALRLFGARIGRRTWIGTTFLTEFDLVEIGHDATVGHGVSLQTHLFEDRVMKMSVVRIGAGASVGTRSIVLYDAEIGPEARLDALSLLMKGEHLTPSTRWRGIPAQGVT